MVTIRKKSESRAAAPTSGQDGAQPRQTAESRGGTVVGRSAGGKVTITRTGGTRNPQSAALTAPFSREPETGDFTGAGTGAPPVPKWTQVQADWQTRFDGESLLRKAAQETARERETADALNQAALQKQLRSLQGRQSELTAGLDLNGAGELQPEIDSLKKQLDQARREEEARNQTPLERQLAQLQSQKSQLEAGLDLTGAGEVQSQIDSLKEQIWQEELAASGGRQANLWDLTGGSILRGYQNSVYGQESYQEMRGRENQAQEKARELAGEKYNFVPKGTAAKGISGAAELLGQQVRQWIDPDSLILGGAAAAAAGIAGQMGPQVLAPEEVVTMPAAFLSGMQMGSAKVNFEIEAGLAYQEMIENGISPSTASKIASVVGLGNAALELVQMDELVKSFRVLNRSGASESIMQAIGNELVERGLDVAKETAQEVAQEGVTITGSQIANQLEKGEWAYGTDEVLERLGDTALSSALSFGVLNVPGGAYNVKNAAREGGAWRGANETLGQTAAEMAQEDFSGPQGVNTQKKTAQVGGEAQYSLKAFSDGHRFVDVVTDQALFDQLSEKEKTRLAIQIIKERFAGKVIGLDHQIFVNGRSAAEYGHPVKNIESDIRDAKMRASTELDNLVDAGTNFRTAPDGADGHIHPRATGGFEYFDVTFKIGEEYYKGVINIENTAKGRRLKDITKIESITQDISSSYGTSPKSTFLRDTSIEDANSMPVRDTAQGQTSETLDGYSSLSSISQEEADINPGFSQSERAVQAARGAFGENGVRGFELGLREGADQAAYFRGYAQAYNAGLAGKDLRGVEAGTLTQAQRGAAYAAGRSDADAAARKTGFTTVWGKDSGLVRDGYVESMDQKTAGQINQAAKMLGVKVQFVERVAGGKANAQLEKGIISIEKDNPHPVRALFGHELTHRIQELAPRAYQAFRAAALADTAFMDEQVQGTRELHAKNGVELDSQGAMDEIAADYAGRLMEDGQLLERFIDSHRADRTLLEKVRDAFRSLADRATGKYRSQAKQAEQRLTEALEAAAKETENLAGQQGNARGTMESAKFSLKEETGHGDEAVRSAIDTGAVGESEEGRRFLREAAERGQTGRNFETRQGEVKRDLRIAYRALNEAEIAPNAKNIQEELKALGIESFVHDGDLQYYLDGTISMEMGDSVTINKEVIGIKNSIDIPAKNVAGHEAYHYWSEMGKGHEFHEQARAGIQYNSRTFRKLYEHIKQNYFNGEIDLTNDNAVHHFYEELIAEISGMFLNGESESLNDLLNNYDEVKTAWSTMVKNGGEGTNYSLKGTLELGKEINRLMREAQETGRSEAEVQEEIQALVEKVYYGEQQKWSDQLRKQKEHQKEKDATARERRTAGELRDKITRHTKQLSQKLLRPSDKQHIPENLREPVAAMLEAINQESQYTVDQETGKRTKGGDGLPVKRTEAFRALKEQYAKIIAEGGDMVIDPSLLGNDAEGIRGNFDTIIAMRDTKLADMSVSQLETVWQVVKAVEHSVSTAGKLLSKAKYAGTRDWANAMTYDTASRRAKTSITKGHALIDMETPYTFFSHFGDAGKAVYRMLRNAQDQQQIMVDGVADKVHKIVDSKTVKSLEEVTQKFTTVRGEELTLSTAQVMELYELMKREQSHDHLLKGGIVQPEIKSAKIRRGTDSIRLTEEDLTEIIGTLTDKQAQIADGLQSLTTGLLASYGNEASMAAYGYKKFTGTDYWPIKSAKEGIHASVERGGNNTRSIKNIGMAKATMPHASNPLDIAGIFATFSAHTSDMTDYAAWLCTMEDANRLFNFQFRDGEGNLTGKTVKGILDRVGGVGSQKYWHNLMEDIQNGINAPSDSPTWDIIGRGIGSFKGAAVGGNIRVVIQQPTAFFRAAAVLSPVDLSRGLAGGVTRGNGWKKALQYSPIAMRKAGGSFDISSPRKMSEILFDSKNRVQRLNDALSAPAGVADAITWGRLWNACEWATVREHNDLAKGGPEFYTAVNALFTEVIDQTQVVDGVLQRANIMRSSNAVVKQATSFMGEPMMSLNLMLRAYDQVRYEQNPQRRGKAIKVMGRAATALVVTQVVNALAQSLIDALRDDDEDKKYWERFMSAFTGIDGDEESVWDKAMAAVFNGNVGSNMNLLGQIPFVKDALSMLQGYDVNRTEMEIIADLIEAGQTAAQSADGDGKKTRAYAVKELLAAGAKVFGIPIGNLARDMWGLARSMTVETDNIPLQYEMEKAIFNITNDGNKGRYYDILFRALAQEDIDSYQYIRKELMERMGVDGASIDSSMRSRYGKALEADPGFTLSQQARDLIGSRDHYAVETVPEETFGAENLGAEMYESYSIQRANDYREMANELKESPIFQDMDNLVKDNVLKAAYELASQTALEDASGGQYEVETKWMTLADDAERVGIEPWEYVLFHTAYSCAENTKDEDGKAVQGESKGDHVREWLEGCSGLTEGQRKFLWGTVYQSKW